MEDAELISVDTETSGLDPHTGARLAGISFYYRGDHAVLGEVGFSHYFPFRHSPGETLLDQSENLPEEWLHEYIKPILERTDVTWIGQGRKFDWSMFRADGIEVTAPFYDTLIMGSMVNENMSHRIEDMVDSILGWNTKPQSAMIRALSRKLGGHHKIPPRTMAPYAEQDVKSAFYLYEHFKEDLEQQEMWDLWEREMNFSQMLLKMEWRGIKIDRALANRLSSQATARMRQIEDTLGFDPMKPSVLAHKLYAAPPEGLGLPILERNKDTNDEFPDGIPKMDEKTLSTYDDETSNLVLEYRGLVKANSTWYEGFVKKLDSNDRLHPIYNWREDAHGSKSAKTRYGTKTTRLSASPNIQQLPRDPTVQVRKMLIPASGYELWSFDYDQVELRLAAVYAQEERLLDAFRRGDDIHRTTGDLLGLDRSGGKTCNFAIIYGAGAERLSISLGITLEAAESILKHIRHVYPGLARVSREAVSAARERGWVRLWTGRRCHIVDAYDASKAFNKLIQGGAAELMRDTMLKFYTDQEDWAYHIVAQVHDDLIFEIKKELVKELVPTIKSVMEWPGEVEEFTIPFTVSPKLLAA